MFRAGAQTDVIGQPSSREQGKCAAAQGEKHTLVNTGIRPGMPDLTFNNYYDSNNYDNY